MNTLIAMVAGSLKALVLLAAAAGVTAALGRRPARLRVVVWSTALAGSLADSGGGPDRAPTLAAVAGDPPYA